MELSRSTQLAQASIRELASRFRSKRELHSFMLVDCKVYVPKYSGCTTNYMKDVLKGVKSVISINIINLVSSISRGSQSKSLQSLNLTALS
jgi:hypothetical protein